MNNIISVSGGNDSIAMLLVIDRLHQQDPLFFKGDTWHVCYFNTGWAITVLFMVSLNLVTNCSDYLYQSKAGKVFENIKIIMGNPFS